MQADNRVKKLAFVGGGLGSIAGYLHFVGSRMDNLFDVVCGSFSRNWEKNLATAKYWNVKRIYANYQELMEKERENIDAVVILLPTPDHKDAVELALNMDIPVICEKPLAKDLQEVEAIKNKVNSSRAFTVITYNYIAYPMVMYARRLLQEGAIGIPYTVKIVMPQESFLRVPQTVKDYPPSWRKRDGQIPTIMLDLLSHCFSIFKFLFPKEKLKVIASTIKKFSQFNVVDDVKVLAETDGGATCIFWVSKTALGEQNGLRFSIYGSEGSLSWIQTKPDELFLSKKDGSTLNINRSYAGFPYKERVFNRMMPGHPVGFVETFANLYYYYSKALELHSQGENYAYDPIIWTVENELENFQFLTQVCVKGGHA